MDEVSSKHLLKNFDLALGICEKAFNSYEVVSRLFDFYEAHGKGSEFSQFITQMELKRAGNSYEEIFKKE